MNYWSFLRQSPKSLPVRALLLLAAAGVLVTPSPVWGQMFKCSTGGKTYYQDGPCGRGAAQKDMAPRDAMVSKSPKSSPQVVMPPPIRKAPIWEEAEREAFAADCGRREGKRRTREYTRKHGARLPVETEEQWVRESSKPCECLLASVSTRWSYQHFEKDRERLEPMLRAALPECFSQPAISGVK